MEKITKIKVTDKTLYESEERYRLLMEGARIIGWEYDPYEDRFTFVSGKAQEITGYTIEQWGEKGFWASHIHHEDKDFAVQYCKNAIKKGEDHEFEYRMITADGGFVWLRDIAQVDSNNGKVTNLRGVLVDISHHKRIAENLELFKALVDQTNDAIFIIDSDTGNIIDINKEACKSLGYEREEILNMKINNIVASPKEFFREKFEKLKTKGYMKVEGEHKRKDNTTFPVEVNAKAVVFKDKRYVIAVARDITERKKAEEQNKTILRTALDGFWITDIEGRLLEVNDAYCNLIGYSHEELLKMSIPDVEALESPEDTKKHIQQIIKTGSDRFESKHRCKNGRIIDIEISTNYMDTKGGRFFVFIRDITERKKAEKILQEQKKALEKKNIALHEVLGQIEIEKKQIKDNVIANAETLLLPIIEKISLKEESRKYAQLLQKNLHELTSSFGAGLSDKKSRLTSREIDICNMIKNGLISKEIAGLLNISLQTIEKHRSHIRKKLGIVNEKCNLTSVLKTL